MRYIMNKSQTSIFKFTPFLLFFLSAFYLAPFVHAEEAEEKPASFVCELEKCIEAALLRHPDIKTAEARRLTAVSKIELEEAEWRPRIYLEAESGYLEGKSATPFGVTSDTTEEGVRVRDVSKWYYSGSAVFDAPLMKGGRLLGMDTPETKKARQGLVIQENLQYASKEYVIFNVKKAYTNVVKLSKIFESQKQMVKIVEVDYNTTLARFNQNLISKNELLISEVRLATAKRDLTLYKNSLEQAKRELARSIGLAPGTRVDITNTQQISLIYDSLPSVDELLVRAYQQRPEIRAQHAQIKAKEADVSKAQSEWFPSIDLMAKYGYGDDYDPPGNSEWRAFVHLTVPIFDFGITAKRVSVARAEVTEEKERLDGIKANIVNEVNEGYTQIAKISADLNLLDKQIEQAKESVKLNQAKFDQQLASSAALAEAKAALLKLEQAKIQANHDRMIAGFQLELVTGAEAAKSP
jgi:outer membrane protein TolC